MSKVAVLKAKPKTALQGYKRLMHLAGYRGAISKEIEDRGKLFKS